MDNRTTDQATNTFFKTNVSKFQDQHFQDQHFQDQHFQDQHFQDQPFPHDVANMSTMENSPEDIKHLVVENISDIRTFESIVDASPTFKTLYNSKPKYFLTKLIDRAVHNNIQREALIALQSSMTMDIGKARRPKMIEFLHTRYGSHEPSPLFSDPIIELPPLIPKNIDMAALNLISELHRTVQFLTADFCSYIEESQVDNKSPQIRFSLPLSESETCRIQRAFYRIEIFSNLFWKKTCKTEERFYIDSNKVSWVRCRDPGKPVNRWEKRGDHVSLKSKDLVAFCESFPAWENEEIACIREYMRAKIAKCFATVASDYAKVVRRRKMEPDSGGSIFWDFDLSPEENLKDDATGEGFYIDNQITQGLGHFEKLIKSTDKQELTHLIIKNLGISTECNGLAAALEAKQYQDVRDMWIGVISYDDYMSGDYSSAIQKTREKFSFKGDENYLTSPNLGYANHVAKVESDVLEWSRYYHDTLLERDDGMRARGYAFWDAERFAEFDSRNWFGTDLSVPADW